MRLVFAVLTLFSFGILPGLSSLLIGPHVAFRFLPIVGGQDVLEFLTSVPLVTRLIATPTVPIPDELVLGLRRVTSRSVSFATSLGTRGSATPFAFAFGTLFVEHRSDKLINKSWSVGEGYGCLSVPASAFLRSD